MRKILLDEAVLEVSSALEQDDVLASVAQLRPEFAGGSITEQEDGSWRVERVSGSKG